MNNGVYWVGSNGLVYVKGSQGTNAAGRADANTNNYWGSRGFSRINDPNPPPKAWSAPLSGTLQNGRNIVQRTAPIPPATGGWSAPLNGTFGQNYQGQSTLGQSITNAGSVLNNPQNTLSLGSNTPTQTLSLPSDTPTPVDTGPSVLDQINKALADQQARQDALNRAAAEKAAADEAARVARLRAGFDTQQNALNSSLAMSGQAEADKLHSGILDFLDQYKAAQLGIDRQGQQNQLTRTQGQTGILRALNSGLKSSGTMLGNRNAGSSSGMEALSRAYGQNASGQNAQLSNNFIQGQNSIANAQLDLGTQVTSQQRKIEEAKAVAVNKLVQDAQTQFAALDAAKVNANIPDRIDIEAEKNKIRTQVTQQLAAIDGQLTNGVAQNPAASADAVRTEGKRLASLGNRPEKPFQMNQGNFQFQTPTQAPTQLPIFTFGKQRKLTQTA